MGDIRDFILNKVLEISKKNDFIVDEINSDFNHLHILIDFNPNITIKSIVRVIKQETTFHVWKNFNNILINNFFRKKTFWSDGYFVCSIGYNTNDIVKNYIKNQ